jgi:hypothetical protein
MKKALLLLGIILLITSCSMTTHVHIDFVINWWSVLKTIGWILLGAIIMFLIFIIMWENG